MAVNKDIVLSTLAQEGQLKVSTTDIDNYIVIGTAEIETELPDIASGDLDNLLTYKCVIYGMQAMELDPTHYVEIYNRLYKAISQKVNEEIQDEVIDYSNVRTTGDIPWME